MDSSVSSGRFAGARLTISHRDVLSELVKLYIYNINPLVGSLHMSSPCQHNWFNSCEDLFLTCSLSVLLLRGCNILLKGGGPTKPVTSTPKKDSSLSAYPAQPSSAPQLQHRADGSWSPREGTWQQTPNPLTLPKCHCMIEFWPWTLASGRPVLASLEVQPPKTGHTMSH